MGEARLPEAINQKGIGKMPEETVKKTLVEGWVMPEAPVCPDCGAMAVPTAEDVGGETALVWFCRGCHEFPEEWEEMFIDWPFEEERCSWEDLKGLGFYV